MVHVADLNPRASNNNINYVYAFSCSNLGKWLEGKLRRAQTTLRDVKKDIEEIKSSLASKTDSIYSTFSFSFSLSV